MQNAASLPADLFDELLRRLPARLDLDAFAHQTKAIERKREIDFGADLLRLALARGPGGLSLSQTAACATMPGLAEMSDPAVKYRLDKVVEFLDAVTARHWRTRRPVPPCAGPDVPRVSATAVASASPAPKPPVGGCMVSTIGCGGFCHLELADKHGAETIERGAPVRGEIRIGDRGFARAPSLHRFRQQSANHADFIVRAGWAAFSRIGQNSTDFDLIAHPGVLPADMAPHEVMVRARPGPLDPALPLRLIIQRKTLEATEAARAKLRREASRKQAARCRASRRYSIRAV